MPEDFETEEEPAHKGHYECPKCSSVQHGPGVCPKCGVPMESAD